MGKYKICPVLHEESCSGDAWTNEPLTPRPRLIKITSQSKKSIIVSYRKIE